MQWRHVLSVATLLLIGTVAHAATPLASLEGQRLVIQRSALDIPLAYFPATIKDTRTDFPELWEFGNLVRFSVAGKTLTLWQLPGSAQSSGTNQLDTLLAEFPIVQSTAQSVTIDFNDGTLQHTIAPQNGAPLSAPIQRAELRQAAATDTWFSVVQSIHRIDRNTPRTTWYRYTFWRADASTVPPLVDDPRDQLGYFNTPVTQFGDATPRLVVRRWHPDKPITFYVSANTPARYRDAIKAGVLAWNHTRPGTDFVRVADAPASVLPGDPRYPLILWVEDRGGLGVGMAQGHPVTGETFTGLVIIKAGWTQPPANTFLIDSAPAAQDTPFPGAQSATLCRHTDDAAHRAEGAHSALWDLGGSERETFVQRQLTAVIMHEIGHVLGLRHNFAGNLGTTIARDAATDWAAQLQSPVAPDSPLPSSSIMDYLPAYDDIQMHRPGVYDQHAIQFAYDGMVDDTAPLFCTDDDVGYIADCQRRDGSADPIHDWSIRLDRAIARYNDWVITHAIVPADQIPVEPTTNNEAWQLIYLIRQGLGALQSYQSGHTWALYGEMPIERALRARAVLQQLHSSTNPRFGDFVRPALANQINRLEQTVKTQSSQAAWATQVMNNIYEFMSMLNE